MKKPIFFLGFILYDQVEVMKRISSHDLYEVYQLSNDKFACFFLDIHEAYINKIKKELKEVILNEIIYRYIELEEYNAIKLEKYIDSLMNPKGFEAVAGMNELKKTLYDNVIRPLKDPKKYTKFKLTIPSGILLFGPPGCGKTFIVRRLAEEIGYHFIEVKHSDLASTYIHGMVQKIKDVFVEAEQNKPSIVFFDEIDGLIPSKSSLGGNQNYKHEEINEFLMQFNDAGKKNILIVGATNNPQLIDEALLRPGRMDKIIYVSPPDKIAREQLFRIFLEGIPVSDINYKRLSIITEGYASVDIEYIVKESARNAIEENQNEVNQINLESVIYKTKSSITIGMINKYKEFNDMIRE